ncbi:hypothetical protein F0562_033165 [Nyssa sinensis]|uniref:Uncharacterized protein n=1 Tax=Nyssa sinensis TaxID=561372 RepID=A0A5J5AUB4_9ASTE|nr:hypothetical protein F0562_033165 [Nyssa sinensis]
MDNGFLERDFWVLRVRKEEEIFWVLREKITELPWSTWLGARAEASRTVTMQSTVDDSNDAIDGVGADASMTATMQSTVKRSSWRLDPHPKIWILSISLYIYISISISIQLRFAYSEFLRIYYFSGDYTIR